MKVVGVMTVATIRTINSAAKGSVIRQGISRHLPQTLLIIVQLIKISQNCY